MLAKLRARLTYANVVSSLCLFVLVGGGLASAADPNSVVSGDIVDGQVKNVDLGANSVGTGKVIDNSLTGADIAAGAVGASEIAAGAVGSGKIAPGAVGSEALADGAVGSAKIAPGAVGSQALGQGAVGAANLAAGAVVTGALANGAVNSSKIADGAVSSADIASGAVGSLKLADRAVLSQKIALGTIQDANIALDTITGQRLAAGTITQREIRFAGVGSSEIAPGAVGQSDIAENGVASSEIASGAVGTSEHAVVPGARVSMPSSRGQVIEDKPGDFNCENLSFDVVAAEGFDFDHGDMFNSTNPAALRVPLDGVYAVTAFANWNGAGGTFSTTLRRPTGSANTIFDELLASQTVRDGDKSPVSGTAALKAGQTVNVRACWQGFGASRSVSGASFFSAQWLGPLSGG